VRESLWAMLVGAIHDYDWPQALPSEIRVNIEDYEASALG
jgi:hypothetical protein